MFIHFLRISLGTLGPRFQLLKVATELWDLGWFHASTVPGSDSALRTVWEFAEITDRSLSMMIGTGNRSKMTNKNHFGELPRLPEMDI